jgi:hypothetical protein
MTQEDFLTALHAIAPRFRWYVDDTGHLRGYGEPFVCSDPLCPLTALAHCRTGSTFAVTEWDQAFLALGLHWDDASDIVGAADDDGSAPAALREALLAAVGLADAAGAA